MHYTMKGLKLMVGYTALQKKKIHNFEHDMGKKQAWMYTLFACLA